MTASEETAGAGFQPRDADRYTCPVCHDTGIVETVEQDGSGVYESACTEHGCATQFPLPHPVIDFAVAPFRESHDHDECPDMEGEHIGHHVRDPKGDEAAHS